MFQSCGAKSKNSFPSFQTLVVVLSKKGLKLCLTIGADLRILLQNLQSWDYLQDLQTLRKVKALLRWITVTYKSNLWLSILFKNSPHCEKISNCVQKLNFQKNLQNCEFEFSCQKSINYCDYETLIFFRFWIFAPKIVKKLTISNYCWFCTYTKSRFLARKFKLFR